MAEISKLSDKQFTDPVKQPTAPVQQYDPYGFPIIRPGESSGDYSARVNNDASWNTKYGTDKFYKDREAGFLNDLNNDSSRLTGLIDSTRAMGPKASNSYGADPSIYAAIDNRAKENYSMNMKGLESKLKTNDFFDRQNRMARHGQQLQSELAYEHQKLVLKEQQDQAKKAKRGAVIGNVLGIVGAVVGGIFGGPQGAQAGMQAGQGIGNYAGSG